MSTRTAFIGWPSSASFLYLVSAACLLGGAAYVLAPGAADEARIVERFAMLGTVQVYVAALAGLALLLCRWQPGNEDAEALVVLLSLFLPGMHAGLGTIASTAPWTALALGVGGLCGSTGWMLLIQRRVTGLWGWQILAPLAVVQAWNALAPGVLGVTYHAVGVAPEQLLGAWLPGWWLQVAAGVWLVWQATGSATPVDADCPLVRRESLRWFLIILAWMASGLHQWLLGYAFNLGLGVLDFCAAIMLTGLLIVVVLRRFDLVDLRSLAVCEAFAGFWCTLAVTNVRFSATPDHLLSLACYPPLLLGGAGVALLLLAWRTRHVGTAVAATVWLLGTVFTWGITADHVDPNWQALGTATLTLAALVLALPWSAPPALVFCASIALLLAGWMHPSLGPAILTALAGVAHAWHRRKVAFAGVGGLPLALRGLTHVPDLLRAAGGWCGVVAAFVLLAVGAWISWRRVQGTPPPNDAIPPTDHRDSAAVPAPAAAPTATPISPLGDVACG
jgi:hypothetical protein